MSEHKWLSTQHIRINGQRLWDSLMAMAKIGATAKGGCNRQALTDLDKAGRDLFVKWSKEVGCSIKIDPMGNIIARRAGKLNDSSSVLTGSHLDTQPTGGKFDGVHPQTIFARRWPLKLVAYHFQLLLYIEHYFY